MGKATIDRCVFFYKLNDIPRNAHKHQRCVYGIIRQVFDRIRKKCAILFVEPIEFIEDYLGKLDVPFVRVPNAEGNKAAIFTTVGPLNDGGIVLSGHTDVVPVAGQSWTSDPFTVRRDGTERA